MNKYYDFVPFLESKAYNKRGNLEGKINLKLETLTPVHVSSGKYNVDDDKVVYKVNMRNNGNVVIPATSIKGCIRNIAEAVSYSCTQGFDKKINKDKISVNKKDYNNCIICNMFGAMGAKSKVRFSDFKMESGKTQILSLPKSFDPKPESKFYYDENGKYKGYKFYKHGINGIQIQGSIPYEYISSGSQFTGDVMYENLTEEQLELLCFSLGLSGDISPKIGYGKTFLYGSVRFYSEDEKWKDIAETYKNNKDKKISENITKLIKILNFDNAVKAVED
ncbi:RAMP superfamily CRISPR-associated protein [Clostridium sp.]|uniref:RAMP superfamily CRISPR-associated protein n=1 Tax=Clostridium sp. TaxID=1506 RepID=UPI003A5C55F0